MKTTKILLCAFLIIGTAAWAPVEVITERGKSVGIVMNNEEVYLRTYTDVKLPRTGGVQLTLMDHYRTKNESITVSEEEINRFISDPTIQPAYDVEGSNPEEWEYRFETGIYPNGPRIGKRYLELNQYCKIDDFWKDTNFDTKSLDEYLARVESKLDGGRLSDYFVRQLDNVFCDLQNSRIGSSKVTVPKSIMCALLSKGKIPGYRYREYDIVPFTERQKEILNSITSLYERRNKPTQQELDRIWNIGVDEKLWSTDSITIKFEGRTRIGIAAEEVSRLSNPNNIYNHLVGSI